MPTPGAGRGATAAADRPGPGRDRRTCVRDRELPGPHRGGRERPADGQRVMRRLMGRGGRGAGQIVPQVREGTKVKFRMTRRRAAVLLAFLAMLLGIPLTAPASNAAASTGWIRLGNLSATTSAVDIYVYSPGDSS